MPFPQIDPVFFRLGPLEFRWYGLMYIMGFIASYFILQRGARRRGLPFTKDDVADIIFSLALGVILGGRLGYIVFYNAAYYLAHPLKVLAVWEGGMSFHGGLIGVVLAGICAARKKRIGFFALADLCVPAVPVGLGLGRIGNFINGELYGRVTDVPWGIVFPGGGGAPRHPSQLYEAVLEGPVLFAILAVAGRKERPTGAVFWTFVATYGLFRFFVEFFREPDAQLGLLLGPFSMGQFLSFPMFLLGVTMVFVVSRRGKR
ncbi:prolipoprotein diacylglyceryl transferase [Geobacter pickeringii]|uniref:Phosphatidylglycerol--prolipoprotein diacylglyceryl transferase n=1 Tax=Geobacter pickeringii TaxID=345632 RepID=A0A0B5BAJ7_9BACT|nr:prolipoprotein diacylglyceryl transferase [Geobacter pickeringii]AJE03763.1 diacylglyceryl transferase [Geobacter pickeringii]